MQFAIILALTATMASSTTAAATPMKRSYVPGQCGLHISQQTRANDDDLVTTTVYDNDDNEIGSHSAGLSAAEPQEVQSYLPESISLRQPSDSHTIDITYVGYQFGTSSGCSVGDWDNGNQGTREMDCGFGC